MKKLILIIILLTSLAYPQAVKSVLTQAQKDSIGAMIRDSLGIKIKHINVDEFGAIPNDGLDDSQAIQDAVDYAIANASTNKVIFSLGTYNIDSPIFLMKRSGITYSFFNLDVEGSSNTYGGRNTTKIVPSFNDKPAILIQLGKGVKISNLEIVGKNVLSKNVGEILADTGWTPSGARDNRCSPYCAIAIDPFGNDSTNGGGDAGGYPNLGSYYTASGVSGSTKIELNNLVISSFVVGIMLTPNNYTQNDEDISINHCMIDHSKVCIAIGQDQSRSVYVNDLICWGNVSVVFDSYHYGRQIGVPPRVNGANIAGGVRYLFISPSDRETLSFNNIYAESLWSIGYWGYNGSGYSGKISNSHIDLIDPTLYNENYPETHFHTSSLFQFDNTYLGCYNNTAIPLLFTGNATIKFTNVAFDALPLQTKFYDYSYLKFDNCHFRYATNAYPSLTTQDIVTLPTANNINKYAISPYAKYLIDDLTEYDITQGIEKIYLGDGSLTINPLTKIGTMTLNDTGIVKAGDYLQIYDIHPGVFIPYYGVGVGTYEINELVGIVSSVNGYTVTLNRIPKNVVNGTYGIQIYRLPIFHNISFGTTTSGSNTIYGVTSASTYWSVGDRIKGTGIPTASYITYVSNDTLVISRKATASATISLYDATYTKTARRTSIPDTGSWRVGDYVENTTPAETGSSGSKYIVRGWNRITNGNNNILNTDWVEERTLTGN